MIRTALRPEFGDLRNLALCGTRRRSLQAARTRLLGWPFERETAGAEPAETVEE